MPAALQVTGRSYWDV